MSELFFIDADSDSQFERYAAVEAEAFGEPLDESLAETMAGRQHTRARAALVGDEMVGGYGLMPVGQYFGGRSVQGQAVVSVFVHPAWRRRGVAGGLLADMVRVAREMGTALVPLYASTTRLYRRHGWEVGDRTLWCTLQAAALARLHGEGRARADPDRAAVEAMRRGYIHRFDGAFVRPDSWLAVHWDTFGKADARREYGWYEGDALTGHVTFVLSMSDERDMSLRVQDLVAATPDALRGLLGLLGSYESVVSHVLIKRAGQLMRELDVLLPDFDKVSTLEGAIFWMQRVVQPGLAVAQRGWPGGDGRVELELSDPCDDAPQRLVLSIDGGQGRLEPGGAGRVRCGIGAFSAWYSARLPAWRAERLGLLEGPAADIELMDLMLGGRPAIEPDYF